MKLDANSCRKMAWQQLNGRWENALLTGLVASLLGVFTSLFTGVLKMVIFSFFVMKFCEGVPFHKELTMLALMIIAFLWVYVGSFARLGYIDYNLSILDQRATRTGLLFENTDTWWDGFLAQIILVLGTTIGTMFFIIPGVLFYYNYAMAPFIVEELKGIPVLQAFSKSRTKMKGYKTEFFILRLSFIGWRILSVLTLGLGYLWEHPYQSLAETVFFNEVSGRAKAFYGRER